MFLVALPYVRLFWARCPTPGGNGSDDLYVVPQMDGPNEILKFSHQRHWFLTLLCVKCQT